MPQHPTHCDWCNGRFRRDDHGAEYRYKIKFSDARDFCSDICAWYSKKAAKQQGAPEWLHCS